MAQMGGVGRRLRKARDFIGLSQEEVARSLKISRSRYSEIETGKGNISIDELYRFADLFNRPIEFFLKSESKREKPFGVLLRAVSNNLELAKAVAKFEMLSSNLANLEKLLYIKAIRIESEDYPYDFENRYFWAKHYAQNERNFLGLGKEPIKNLSEILAEKRGIKVFALGLPEHISGMFNYNKNLGGCILINKNHPAGRQLFSLAHEYGHYVFHKKKIAVVDDLSKRQNRDEKFVDLFATEFLMPEETMRKIFYTRVGKNEHLSAEDILYISDYFGTSFEATLNRLCDLRLVSKSLRQELMDKRWIKKLRKAMKLPEPPGIKENFPLFYKILCIKAFLKNKISTAKLADLLEIPLYQAMELAQKLRKSEKHPI